MLTDPSRSRVPGPLEPFAVGFARELERQGYTRSSAQPQVHLMARLSRWLEDKGLDVHELRNRGGTLCRRPSRRGLQEVPHEQGVGAGADLSARATSGGRIEDRIFLRIFFAFCRDPFRG